jgi:hypothetical protein
MRNEVIDGILALPLPLLALLLYLRHLQLPTTITRCGCGTAVGGGAETITMTMTIFVTVEDPVQASLVFCSMTKLQMHMSNGMGKGSRYSDYHSFLSFLV